MSQSRFLTICVLVLVGAFAGAWVGSQGLPIVHAQMDANPPLRSSSFTLVNQQGKVQATLHSGGTGAILVMNDAAGNNRVEIGASGGIVIRDPNGRVTWSSPRTGVLPAVE